MIDRHQRLAFDRSRRVVDGAGHMFVPACNISKAQVSEYLGSEIPDARRLGMDANRAYPLLRDPRELQAGAASFEGKPLMLTHRPQSAADHNHEIVVGSVSNVKWAAPYLTADLSVWDGAAIAAIESGAQRELSCGYFYDVDPTPGTYQGQRYSGRMTNIRANHVSLVSEGRAGPDVMVGDAAINKIVQQALRRIGMATDADSTVRAALIKIISVMTGQSPPSDLDDVLSSLDDGTDAGPAMDAMRRRKVAHGRIAQDRRAAASFAQRFPDAGRLIR